MKTYHERAGEVMAKITRKKRQRRIMTGAVSGCVILAVALVLFVPLSKTPPSVLVYSGSPYYGLIQQLNKAIYDEPEYENRFEMLADSLGNMAGNIRLEAMAPGDAMPEMDSPTGDINYGTTGSYQEVTDNQVEGVIEADLFKRSDKYLYYLRRNVLSVYSIAGEESKLVGEFCPDLTGGFGSDGKAQRFSYYSAEMYLSQDCTTVTLVAEGYRKDLGSCTVVMNLDVTDPANITQRGFTLFEGSYLTSRMVGDSLLLTYNYQFYKNDIDFSDPSTFVPEYITDGVAHCVDAEDIICPGTVTDTRYTVVCKLDRDLRLLDTAALLSFSQSAYVSDSTIYATHSYAENENKDGKTILTAKTRIIGLDYTGDTFVEKGTVTVNGTVNDQYSLDEYNGILRVVTTTETAELHETSNGSVTTAWMDNSRTNCDLYCIDLSDWSVRSSVVAFAPEGEEVTSARFEGDKAYVCTALVVKFSDPVFFFDLSDVDNITWTDTGTIDGFSSSMINFGEGKSLGVGMNGNRELKLEVYAQGMSNVESVCAYEYCGSFSQEYKSYYIDRENSLVGLAVSDWSDAQTYYLLLHFDGYQFREILKTKLAAHDLSAVRSVIIDGWSYILGDQDFQTRQIW